MSKRIQVLMERRLDLIENGFTITTLRRRGGKWYYLNPPDRLNAPVPFIGAARTEREAYCTFWRMAKNYIDAKKVWEKAKGGGRVSAR